MKKSVLVIALAAVLAFGLSAADKVVLTWWGWFPTVEDFVVIKAGFEKKYPGIELQTAKFDYDNYVNKLKVEFASGTGPDVMSMKDGALLNQFKPYLADLAVPCKASVAKLTPSIVADAKMRSGGKDLLVVPLGMSSQMFIYYNATMFKKAGIAKVPTTGKEFEDAVAKIKKAFPDVVPLAIGLKDSWFATDAFIMFANMVESGLTEKADQGKIKWNDAKFVKAMTVFKDLVDRDIIPKNSLGLSEYEDAIGLLMDGKAAMLANGSWNAGNLTNPDVKDPATGKPYADRRGSRATDKDIMGAFVMPNFAGGKPVVIGGMDIGMSINKNSAKDAKKLDAMAKLVDYMTVGEGRDYFVGRPGGLLPTKAGASMNMTGFTDKESKDGVNGMVDAYNKYFAASREVSNGAVKDKLAVAIQKVMIGEDIQKTLDEVQAIADRQD